MKSKIIKIAISLLIYIGILIFKIEIPWLKYALFILSYLVVGYGVIKEAIEKILKKDFFNENLLMTIATMGALAIKEFPEAIAVMILYNIGEIFEELGEEKSKKSIVDLMNIRPDYANLKLEDEKVEKVNPKKVKVGDLILVKPGEKIPLDGIIVDGNSTIDTSALTGESMPKEVEKKDEVLSGCINLSGILTIKVTKLYGESTVSKILDLVQNATENKSSSENFITKFSKVYTPIVIILAVGIFVFGLITKTLSMYESIYRALTFLVISCPCALVISVPLSFFSGIGGASKKGILIKASSYMDVLSNLDTIVFDKTGTLTKGVFEVQEIIPNNISKEELIEYVSMAEHFSNHPIANSVKKLYTKKVQIDRITNLEEISGKGIKCKIDNKNVLVGNLKLMEQENIEEINDKDYETANLFVAINGKFAGKIVISDTIKQDSFELIENLKKLGIKKTVILTGDNDKVAKEIAKKLKVDKVYSNLLPDEKIKKLEEILQYNKINKLKKVAYVGDGINDSPALARADVGIAMGALGSDSAIEASDIVIMNDKPSKIIDAIKISQKTIRIAKENIVFSIFIKILILILSLFGLSNMWIAVFADVGVTIIAIINSLRCIKF